MSIYDTLDKDRVQILDTLLKEGHITFDEALKLLLGSMEYNNNIALPTSPWRDYNILQPYSLPHIKYCTT